MAPSADLLLRGAQVYPGEGPPVSADVAVTGDRISAVAPDLSVDAARVLDLDGLALSPGFIDMHSHCALRSFSEPGLACKITQGFTTDLINQDGVGPAPVSDERLADRRSSLRVFEGEGPATWPWRSIAEYLEALDATRPAIGLCPLVPHGAVRDLVIGGAQRAPTAAELDRMRGEVDQGMQAGAWGMSLGLVYPPASFAETDELIELARAVAAYGGFVIPHVRSESSRLLQAVEEQLTIARAAEVALNLTHLKVMGRRNKDLLPRLLELIDGAVDEGLDVTFDQYPYTAGATTLAATLPLWAHEGGPARTLARLADPSLRSRLISGLLDNDGGQENHLVECGAESITIVDSTADDADEIVGLTLAEIAAQRDLDPAEAIIELLLDSELHTTMTLQYADEDTVREIARHERMLVGSDGIFAKIPHPRLWGTAPRVLGLYAMRERLFDLSEAVARLTARAADRIGLDDRGRVHPGLRADLVAFDPTRVIDRATYEQPELPAAGIDWVLVGGEISLGPDGPTGARAGGVVRRRSG